MRTTSTLLDGDLDALPEPPSMDLFADEDDAGLDAKQALREQALRLS